MLPELDVDLGAPGNPIQPVQRAFELRGVSLDPITIKSLRAGTTNPVRTRFRLACVDRLRADDASLKNHFFLHLLRLGLQFRGPSPDRSARVYACRGLSRAIRGALGCSLQDLSQIMRVMRADLALFSSHTWDDDFVTFFRSTAAYYLRAHRRIKMYRLITTNELVDAAWDHHTIHGFYFALHAPGNRASRISWLPYELDLLLHFYERRAEMGSPLTPLDRQVLQGAVGHEPRVANLARMVQAHSSIDYDVLCVTMHRRILATGSFEPVEIPRRGRHPSPVDPPAPSDRRGVPAGATARKALAAATGAVPHRVPDPSSVFPLESFAMTPSQLQTDDVPGALPDLDVDLGASGDPVRPVQHAFGRRGVILSAKTIRALRAGTSSSFRTAVRLACVARLRANDSSLKNRFLLHVLRLGRQLRRPAREGPNPLYHHRGLTRAMAGDLGCTRDDLSRIIRLMRADMALRAFPVWDDDLALFLSTAASFMRAHPRSAIGHAGVPDPEPDYATIRDFYVALSLRGLSTRAAWLPYELDLFFRFYATQQELGSPLTPLDRQVLAGAICHQPPTAELARMVNTHTLIDYGVGGVTLHRHILAAGSFEPIETPRRPPP